MIDKDNCYYEITVKEPHKGEEMKIKVWWEADAWDWQTVFKQIMSWISFHPETYGEIFAKTDDELLEEEENKRVDVELPPDKD